MSRNYQISAWSRRQITDNARLDIDFETHRSCSTILHLTVMADSGYLSFYFRLGKRFIETR